LAKPQEKQLGLFSPDLLGRGVSLPSLRKRALDCDACALRDGCDRVVFGEGEGTRPPVVFVGESPGVEENETGRPFVGPAGKLLVRMVEAMGLTREQVYFCNVVNCRPPNGRVPEVLEIQACREYLIGQLRAVDPLVIVTLGTTAAQAVLNNKKKTVEELAGRWYEWEGIPMRPTLHPAYLLRHPEKKADVWLDLQAVVLNLNKIKKEKYQ